MFLIKVILSLLYCFIRRWFGLGVSWLYSTWVALGVGGLTFNTQQPHYWSRYSPHTMTIRRWWAEIRTWSRHYYGVNVRVYSSYLIACWKPYGLTHCWHEGLFTTKGKKSREEMSKFRTIKVQMFLCSTRKYEGHLESKERFAIQRYLLIIGKKQNMQVLSYTFTYFST